MVVQRFDAAATWEEMNSAVKLLDDDAVLDEVGIYIPGKQRIRVLSLLISFLLTKRLEPTFVSMSMVGSNEAQLEVVTNIIVLPSRRWWIPPTLLLPKEIALKGNTCIRVDGSNDRIICVKARLHNLPTLAPFPIRYALGWVAGSVALLLEPLVLEVLRYFGLTSPAPPQLPNGGDAPASSAVDAPASLAGKQSPLGVHFTSGSSTVGAQGMGGRLSPGFGATSAVPPLTPPQAF
ncbi:MAG: hypothetical protein WDW36_002611 [Sanguina aurantia]